MRESALRARYQIMCQPEARTDRPEVELARAVTPNQWFGRRRGQL
jgi:hypothetical protein